MKISLLEQIKQRRLELGLKQHDMYMRIGISRQQYQRLERLGNPRLDTLELITLGLNSELMLIPNDKKDAVLHILNAEKIQAEEDEVQKLIENTWAEVLGDLKD
jgi:transcriptional regulator with XRE-family HTH domain